MDVLLALEAEETNASVVLDEARQPQRDPDLDDEEKWPIVLTDSLPLGDLSDQELIASVESLWSALSVVPVLLKESVIC